jgi:hypothetical protein
VILNFHVASDFDKILLVKFALNIKLLVSVLLLRILVPFDGTELCHLVGTNEIHPNFFNVL